MSEKSIIIDKNGGKLYFTVMIGYAHWGHFKAKVWNADGTNPAEEPGKNVVAEGTVKISHPKSVRVLGEPEAYSNKEVSWKVGVRSFEPYPGEPYSIVVTFEQENGSVPENGVFVYQGTFDRYDAIGDYVQISVE